MFQISPALNGYKVEQTRQLFERVEDELAALPGVTGVTELHRAAAGRQQLGQQRVGRRVQGGAGHRHELALQRSRSGLLPDARASRCSPAATSRAADALAAPKVAIVNEAFAKKFNLGRDAVGKRMGNDGGNGPLTIEIVGLVKNAKYSDVKGEIPPLFFMPYRQDETIGQINFYVRTAQRSGAVPEQHPEGAGAARREPAGREPADAAAAGARERVPRSVHQRAVGVVRLPGDAARGGRALRRAGVHRVAADARDRPADGARRGAVAGAGDGAAAGRG